MSLIKLNRNPDTKQLRQFGVIGMLGLPLIGWLVSGGETVLALSVSCGLMMGIAAWLSPQILKYAFVALSIITFPIGIVVGELVLLVIYYVVFFAVGLCCRVTGRDALGLKFDRTADSYWTEKQKCDKLESYFRQF